MFKKLFEKEKITIRRYKPIFVTVDGKEHEGYTYNWIITNRLRCSPPNYIMIDVTSDGYLKDTNGVMYLLNNIVSIDWQIVEERQVDDTYSEYQIFISTLE